MVVWQGRTVHLETTTTPTTEAFGPYESEDTIYTDGYTNAGYGLAVETGWLKLAGLQGYGRARWLAVLGEQRSNHTVRVRVAYNYVETWVMNKTVVVTATAGNPQQHRLRFSRQKVEAIKIRIEDESQAGTRESVKLTGLALQIGVKTGVYRINPPVGATSPATGPD